MRAFIVSVSVVIGLLAGCSLFQSTPPAPEPAATQIAVPTPAPAPAPAPAVHAIMPGTKGLRSAQHALNLKGYHLKEDGQPGPRTTAALANFQKKTGIEPAKGQLDGDTWKALGLSEGP